MSASVELAHWSVAAVAFYTSALATAEAGGFMFSGCP